MILLTLIIMLATTGYECGASSDEYHVLYYGTYVYEYKVRMHGPWSVDHESGPKRLHVKRGYNNY